MQLPIQTLTATKNSSGNWEIDYQIIRDTTMITKIIIAGPVGSSINIYRNQTLVDTSLRGDQNANELLVPLVLYSGEMLRLVWTLGTGNAATATIMSQTV